VPEGVFAAGNPCRVLRLLEPHPGPAHPLSTAPHVEDA
jgi:hypothetical protein